MPEIAQAVVDTYEPEPGAVELVGLLHAARRHGPPRTPSDDLRRAAQAAAAVHGAGLPRAARAHPDDAQQQGRPQEPASAAGPAVHGRAGRDRRTRAARPRRCWPAPSPRCSRSTRCRSTSNFFEDLGRELAADRALSAKLRVQRAAARDRHEGRVPATRRSRALGVAAGRRTRQASPEPRTIRRGHGTVPYVLTGVAQTAVYLGFAYLVAFVGVTAYGWLSEATGILDIYLRSVALGGAVFLVLTLLPVVAKWVLIGRWKAGRDPDLGPALLAVLDRAPTAAHQPRDGVRRLAAVPGLPQDAGGEGRQGSRGPLHGAAGLQRPDHIGAGAVIRKDSYFSGYHAESGWIRTGRVDIGGEHSDRRGHRARDRHRRRGRRPARPHVVTADRPAVPAANTPRLSRPGDDRRLPAGGVAGWQQRAPVRLRRPPSSSRRS